MKMMDSPMGLGNPMMMLALIPYALSIKSDVDIDLDEEAVDFFLQSPLGQMAAINANQLVSSIA